MTETEDPIAWSASMPLVPPEAMIRFMLLMEIANERESQREEFAALADDELTPAEWIARLSKHLGRAVTQDPPTFRREMVIVGALALAAIESFDRRFPE